MQESKKWQHEQRFNAQQTRWREAFALLLWKKVWGGPGTHLVRFGSQTWPEPKVQRGASFAPFTPVIQSSTAPSSGHFAEILAENWEKVLQEL